MADLVAVDRVAEEAASYDLTVATRTFSRRAKAVVDDKLSFSAALMRAGEVEGANRLIEEVEAEVRDEEVALIEKVNEVRVARAIRRERITRLRLAKTFAIATIGASLMTFSAMGISLASMLSERARANEADDWVAATPSTIESENTGTRPAPAKDRSVRQVSIGHMMVALTPHQLEVYMDITTGDVDAAVLESFLLSLPAHVVAQVEGVLADATAAEPAETIESLVTDVGQAARRKAAKARRAAEEAQEEEAPAPQDEESPEPSDEDENEQKKKDEPEDNEGGGGGLPIDPDDL